MCFYILNIHLPLLGFSEKYDNERSLEHIRFSYKSIQKLTVIYQNGLKNQSLLI